MSAALFPMFALFVQFASAGEERMKLLVMPLTPSDTTRPEVHTLIPMEGAGGRQWASDTPGFECVGNGEFIEVWVRQASWPSVVPKAVVCSDGVTQGKAKVQVVDNKLQPMFVGDGSLVLPREKGESAIFKGDPPRKDLGVQQGKSGSLEILCKVERGPVLEVTAYPTMDDGIGRCTLQSTMGETVQFPVVVRTLKRAR